MNKNKRVVIRGRGIGIIWCCLLLWKEFSISQIAILAADMEGRIITIRILNQNDLFMFYVLVNIDEIAIVEKLGP